MGLQRAGHDWATEQQQIEYTNMFQFKNYSLNKKKETFIRKMSSKPSKQNDLGEKESNFNNYANPKDTEWGWVV